MSKSVPNARGPPILECCSLDLYIIIQNSITITFFSQKVHFMSNYFFFFFSLFKDFPISCIKKQKKIKKINPQINKPDKQKYQTQK